MKKSSDNIMAIIGIIGLVVIIPLSIFVTIGSLVGMVNTIIHNIVFFACAVAIFAFVFLCKKVHSLSIVKKLRDHVRWCVTKDAHIPRGGELSLLDYVEIVERKSDLYKSDLPSLSSVPQIPKEYWTTHEEREIASEILEFYQKELMQLYFDGVLYYEKSTTSAEFFLMTLSDFLYKHQKSSNYNGKDTLVYKCSRNEGENTYELTEYGIVYYKLLLFSQLYCGYCKYMKMRYEYTDYVKKIIDTKEITFYY